LWLAWRRHAGCWYLDRLFAVFFWFFLLGPAGAVFYRLTSLYNRHPSLPAGNLPSYQQWQWALEWLPVRYMGLCCCLAGNFTTGFHVWRQWLLDTRVSSADFLAQCLDASLVQESSTETPPEVDESLRLTLMRSQALDGLLVRTEIIGLAGLALVILVLG
jgi:AmpE protein